MAQVEVESDEDKQQAPLLGDVAQGTIIELNGFYYIVGDVVDDYVTEHEEVRCRMTNLSTGSCVEHVTTTEVVIVPSSKRIVLRNEP